MAATIWGSGTSAASSTIVTVGPTLFSVAKEIHKYSTRTATK
jgi:hypothetical protein